MSEWITIDEAAKMLGVSHQTMRNLDCSQIIQVSRTPGGHRRYNINDVRKIKDRKLVQSYFEYLRQEIRRETLEQKQKPDVDKLLESVSDQFSAEEWNVLVYNNFEICNQTLSPEEKVKLRKAYVVMLENMMAPKIVDCRPIFSLTDIAAYMRNRTEATVVECEDLCVKTRYYNIEEFCFWDSEKCCCDDDKTLHHTLKQIANQIDQEVVNDLIANPGTIATGNPNEKIPDLMNVILDKTKITEGHFWILTPPEINSLSLKEIPLQFNCKHYPNCRLLQPNQVLVGLKSTFYSYYGLYPLCLLVNDSKKYPFMSDRRENDRCAIYAKKLFREGSKYFGRIDIQ